jgi:hypothetical protein
MPIYSTTAKQRITLAMKRLNDLHFDLQDLLAMFEDDQAAPPPPPPPFEFIGGPVRPNALRGKDLTIGLDPSRPWISLSDYPNMDLYQCRLPKIYGNLNAGTRLLECYQEGVVAPIDNSGGGSHLIYCNGGIGTKPLGVVIQKHKWINCRSENGLEIKGTDVTVADCEQIDCRNFTGTDPMPESVRLRNGGIHTVANNKGFVKINCRGWEKWIVNNPGARVLVWAGTTAARNTDPQAVMNRPACDLIYVGGVSSVKFGHFTAGQTQYKATRCFAHPMQDNVEVTPHGSVERRILFSMNELRALAA